WLNRGRVHVTVVAVVDTPAAQESARPSTGAVLADGDRHRLGERLLVAGGLRAVDTQLRAAQDALTVRTPDDCTWRGVMAVLHAVEDDLARLSHTAIQTKTAADLRSMRDDLSACLLAATLVDEAAGAHSASSVAILRRFVARARNSAVIP